MKDLALLKRELLAELDRHPFEAPGWIRGCHLQTMWSPALRRVPRPTIVRRERWPTADGDHLSVHFVDGEEEQPLLILLHGLEGSFASNYMLSMTRRFTEHGWSVAAMEFRTCDGEINTAKRTYHSGETSDLDFVVRESVRRRPGRRIFLFSVSLGGNVTVKWLGENGDTVPGKVTAAAVISSPFDLTISGPQIDRALGGYYARRFLKTLIPKTLAKEEQYPGTFDVDAVRRCCTFEEFDTHATAVLHGFQNAWDYWRKVSCGQFLEGIRRPTLLVASADDPFNPGATLPWAIARNSPYIYPQFTDRGGHVGFVYDRPWATRHWAEEQAERFLLGVEAAEAADNS
jgi:predicted alpha/beta-fold hydrolase